MTPRGDLAENEKILIVGGSGNVGRLIVQQLAQIFPSRVIVAGRNIDQATAAADQIGYGTIPRAFDVSSDQSADALNDVARVVVCIDQTGTKFVSSCISIGIRSVDINARYNFLSQVEQLDSSAALSGAAIVLSVGVAPGLTNLMAARTTKSMKSMDRIDVSDQHVIARSLNVPSVSTWFRMDQRFTTWLVSKASQSGLGKLMQRRWCQNVFVWLLQHTKLGSDVGRVVVQATGRSLDGNDTLTHSVTGRSEAKMTAVIVVETIRAFLSQTPAPDVVHIDKVVDLDRVLRALRESDPDLIAIL